MTAVGAGWNHVARPPSLIDFLCGNRTQLKPLCLNDGLFSPGQVFGAVIVTLNQTLEGIEWLNVLFAITAPYPALPIVIHHGYVPTCRVWPPRQSAGHTNVADVNDGDAGNETEGFNRRLAIISHGS